MNHHKNLSVFHIGILLLSCMVYASCDNDDDDYEPAKLATSVFVASDRHESGNGNNLTGVLSAVVNDPDAVIPSVVLLGGDYVGGGNSGGKKPPSDPSTSTDSTITSLSAGKPKGQSNPAFSIEDLETEIDSAMAGNKCQRLYTYGSHDINCTDGYGPFYSGAYEADGYHIFGISYAQVIYDEVPDSTYNGLDLCDVHGCCAREATKYFQGWVAGITDKKPIIIMSHVPLHNQRNDNQGGERWFEVIENAAISHDILVLFCHNHTVEESSDSTTEQQQYLLVPGDQVTTQAAIDKNGKTIISDAEYTHTLNFYYANAGYLKLGYGSLITFRRSSPSELHSTMTIQRYSIIDPTPATIGDTGKPNPYTINLTKK